VVLVEVLGLSLVTTSCDPSMARAIVALVMRLVVKPGLGAPILGGCCSQLLLPSSKSNRQTHVPMLHILADI
jgi:hypothetical protein